MALPDAYLEKIPENLKILLAFLFLSLLAVFYFYPVIDGSLLLTERDLAVFFIPPRLFWAEAVRNWEFPLWNPYSYIGHPLFATLQPGVLYPLNILLVLLPFDLAFNWIIVIHFILAGCFTFLLLRELKAGITGALTGGLVFMLSGYLFSAHNVLSTLLSVTWVPLSAFFFIKAMRGGRLSHSAITGVILTVMFFGGGIEVLFGTFVLLFFLALFPAIFFIEEAIGLKKRFLLFLISAVVFVSLSAIQLIPFLELAFNSTRKGGLSFFEATTWSFDFKDFIQFLIPDPFGYGVSDEKYWSNQSWLKTVYIGTIPFVLSVFFMLKSGKKALPFLLAGLVFLSLGMGRNNALYAYLFEYVPFFNKFRYPVKFLFVPFLFISVSAGLGFEAFKNGMRENGFRKSITALLVLSTLAAVILGALDFYGTEAKGFLSGRGIDYPDYNYPHINIFNTKRLLFFFIISSVCLYGASVSKRFLRILPFVMITLLSTDLFFAHNGFYAALPSKDYHKKSEVMEFLSKDESLFRVFVTPRTMKETIEVPNNGSFEMKVLKSMSLDKERVSGFNLPYHIFDVGGVEVMKRGDYTGLFNILSLQERIDSTNILPMLNVKYVVSLPKIDSPEFKLVKVIGAAEGKLEEVEEEKALKVYENLNYLPRFFIPKRHTVEKRPEEYLKALTGKNFFPSDEVLLEEEPWGEGTEKSVIEADGTVQVTGYRNNEIELKADMKTRGMLVASESWYPGWKAFVDGKKAKVLKADYVLRAVAVDSGTHTVVFKFCPKSFTIGTAISGAALAFLLFAGIYSMRKKA